MKRPRKPLSEVGKPGKYDPRNRVNELTGKEWLLLSCSFWTTEASVEDKAAYRYAPDKWSIKQLVGHVADIERLFAYRALVFARGDKTPLPGMEQDDWVAGSNYDSQTLAAITSQLQSTRMCSVGMFRSFDDEIFSRKGTASGFEFTVRSVAYIMAGHEIHHMRVLRERYL